MRRVALRFAASVTLLSVPLAMAACGMSPRSAAHAGSAGDSAARPSQATTQYAGAAPADPGHWVLTWNSDFSKAGSLNKWQFVTGGNYVTLKQLQWYSPASAYVNARGQLVITAAKAGGHTCWYGPCLFTSARMTTQGRFAQKYGRFEARIKLPPGSGLWPAFWMEGADTSRVGWPAGGEIDVIETNNKNSYLVMGFAHATKFGHSSTLTVSQPITGGFHTYGVDWTPAGITWTFDGYPYAHFGAYKGWPFNQPFYLILDLAVAGSFAGSPTNAGTFPAQMVVDWIHVYRQAGAAS
jgi:beta-glucanase (GH16 family)